MENLSNWILICAFLVGVLLILLIIGATVCVGKSFGLCKKIRGRRSCSPAYERGDNLSSSRVDHEEVAVETSLAGHGGGGGGAGRRLFRYKKPKFARKLNKNQVYWLAASSDDQEPIATISARGECQTPRTIRPHDVTDQELLIESGHGPVKKLLNFDKTSINSALVSGSPAAAPEDCVVIKQKRSFVGSNRWSFHSFNSYASSLTTPVKAAAAASRLALDHDQLLLDQDGSSSTSSMDDQRVSQATLPLVANGSLHSVNFQKVRDAIDNIINENIERTPPAPASERDSILNLAYPYSYNRQADPANISVSDSFLKALSDKRVQEIEDKRKRAMLSRAPIFAAATEPDRELVHF